MFNNCDPATNGEIYFYNSIKNNISIIFDVGCRTDSEFLDFKGTVHYFDPNTEFIEKIKKKNNNNEKSFFNSFGLGNENKSLYYYPRYQSFLNRIKSCSIDDNNNRFELKIIKDK